MILGVQIPFASKDFIVSAEGFSLEKVRDQNGLTFFQGIINDFSKSSSSMIDLSYYNPHGNTSIEYAANISTQDSVVQPPATSNNKFVRYPFITWEPMLIFLLSSQSGAGKHKRSKSSGLKYPYLVAMINLLKNKSK